MQGKCKRCGKEGYVFEDLCVSCGHEDDVMKMMCHYADYLTPWYVKLWRKIWR